jgi:DNA replication ATP-dependent helicase Dna2
LIRIVSCLGLNFKEVFLYRLGKRVISQYIRTGCRRRLRLDLYASDASRTRANAPIKDSRRPGLALLTQQGRAYERAKFRELETIFPDLIVRGADKDFDPGEERAFHTVELGDCIDRLGANYFALEAEYQITAEFIGAHGLGDLHDGSALTQGATLSFANVRPDILQVQPPAGQLRRIIRPSGVLETVPTTDNRLGLKIVDIKISGEASPAHFSELAYYGMALASWLETHGRADRFVVLAEAAIWPGSHDGSTIFRLDREDRTNNVPQRDLARYLAGLDEDLEEMPPEVVLGRVKRFLALELRDVLAVDNWRDLPWHIDHRCSGCDYLGYRWSRHENEAAETNPAAGDEPDELYCWPTAERDAHLSRVAGLTEGAAGKLREAQVLDLVAVSTLQAGNAVFETHQALRAKRTVLRERAVTLARHTAAHIPDRAGTSAVLPRFADIRVSVSADFDIGSGLTFAFGYKIDYGIPNAFQPRGVQGPRYGREFRTIERPLLVLERSLECEGETVQLWLNHMVADIHRSQGEVLAGYRQHGAPDKRDVTLQFFLWDRLTFDHLCRVMGRHLDRLEEPVQVGNVDVSPMAWIFPSENVLEDAEFVSRSSPLTIVSDAVNSLIAAPIPHHYGVIDLANSIEPEGRVLANGNLWNFHVNKFYRDPLSDQIPSERGHEIWERASPFADRDFQAHQEAVRNVVKRKLSALAYVTQKLTRFLGDALSAEAPSVGSVFQPADRLTAVNDDGQIIYQHAKLMASAERMEIELLMAMPPHEREARFKSARVERVLAARERSAALRARGCANRIHDARVVVFQISDRSKEARFKEGEYTWSFLPEVDLPDLQEITTARFKTLHPALERQNPIQDWEYRKKLRESLSLTILRIDRGARLLIVQAGRLLADTLALGLLRMNIDGAQSRFGILDPIPMDVFTLKLKRSLSEQSGIRFPPIAQARPLFPNPRVARVRAGRPRVSATNPPAAEFIWNADIMAAQASRLNADAILRLARIADPSLTPRQCDAITNSVGRRLALWWGPPGTGKSRTAQAYIAGLVASHVADGAPLRVAITGFTWIAIDNVARRIPECLRALGIYDQTLIVRLSAIDNESG